MNRKTQNGTQTISRKSKQRKFQKRTSGVRDSRVRTSALPKQTDKAYPENARDCFLQLQDLLKIKRKKIDPTTCFFENVRNLLSINKGFDFVRLLSELDKVGYDAEWQVINSS